MSVEKIISDWKKGKYEPLYWLEGEEEYFIDQAIDHAEHHILKDSESSFNLSIFYGKDANWADVINACRRYPMFSERQVVLLKEAQHMRDIEKLEPYVENPSPSTILVVSYKDKKLDARKKFTKTVRDNGVLITTKKLQDRYLPEWITELLHSKGLTITQKALAILVDHVGNDLSRIHNEIGKMMINLGRRTQITEEDIEMNIGVSKEFNVFELQKALAGKNLPAAIRIIRYFEANPKAAPIQMVLPALYGFFSKVFMSFGAGNDEKTVAASLGVAPFFVKDYLKAANLYSYPGIEKALLLLYQYNLRSLGVGDAGTEDASLLKEMVVRMVADD
jgi:DNA polymerase-3 subunit delta